MTQPSALLTCFALEVALDVPAPLPRPWHEALAAWPAWDVRREWAARPDAPADLLAAAAGDRHAKVRSAAVGNPVLPLQAALAGAGTCVPYGPLAVATRGDCPDALAARLIAYVGRLGRRRRESWKQWLVRRAPGLAGKPTAQAAALAVWDAVRPEELGLPARLVAVLEPDLQTRVLAQRLATDPPPVPTAVVGFVSALRGTADQRAMVRAWLARRVPQLPPASRASVDVHLRWWCDPQPITGAESATALGPLLSAVARETANTELLELVATAIPHQWGVLDALARNPATDDGRLREQMTALPTAVLRMMLTDYDLGENRGRELARQVLAERRAGATPPPVDVLELPPHEALCRNADVAAVLEPLLGTPALQVLGVLLAGGRASLAQRIVAACGVAGVPVPEPVVGVACRGVPGA